MPKTRNKPIGRPEVEAVPLKGLKPHPRNYRVHGEDQLEHLTKSLREHGFYRPIVTANDLTILAGHGVSLAARELKLKKVPVIRLPIAPDHPRALKVLTGDNEISHLVGVDDRALTELLREINEVDIDGLLGTGYDEAMLAALTFVTRPASEIENIDAAAHWAGMPEFEAPPPRVGLVLSFDSEAERDALVESMALVIAKKTGPTWSAWYPPRERQDLTSLRFESE
tara:strand:+ start:6291 stop:6968 length:678 start_codon:yes stop_codon:yes gene_type:complete